VDTRSSILDARRRQKTKEEIKDEYRVSSVEYNSRVLRHLVEV